MTTHERATAWLQGHQPDPRGDAAVTGGRRMLRSPGQRDHDRGAEEHDRRTSEQRHRQIPWIHGSLLETTAREGAPSRHASNRKIRTIDIALAGNLLRRERLGLLVEPGPAFLAIEFLPLHRI